MNDAYTLLGLHPGVAQKDIKRAFRRLAMQWHPDRNPDPAALEHFKALRAAYERLLASAESGPAAETGTDAPQDTHPAGGDASPGADRRQDLSLTIEEAWLGCEKPVKIAREAECATCGGSGEEALAHTQLCKDCHGSGRVRVGGNLERCKVCAGRGYRTQRTCTDCEGSGRTQAWRTLAVKVPPGLLGGDELRIAGAGEPSPHPDGASGDLRLRVLIAAHDLYRLEGRDLRVSRPVGALRMLAGGDIEVPVPGGSVRLHVEAGKAAPRELRVDGAGFPAGRGQPAGALIVELRPVAPEACDKHQRQVLEELDAELSRKAKRHYPELAEWETNWLPSRQPGRT
ncbi:DnaJ C-terminal domain-containing protein [Thauera sinica]|uniref:DnaJ C-terminal domain-containing protein n=1 Tax=Thauera sinica TaxID=2665146 RepID=A0ABW1AX21_9RHOO|nr:DnaJ C-terminal domain-containing protein [Thauera sp. K11]ATE62585.1 molecular chaperone DnaJ [Thauera sp. K11]